MAPLKASKSAVGKIKRRKSPVKKSGTASAKSAAGRPRRASVLPKKLSAKAARHRLLEKFEGNPIIVPIAEHTWESMQTFNPAAIFEGGKVHIIYRSVGDDGVSRFGYASSRDGTDINERYPLPVFTLRLAKPSDAPAFAVSSSGGSWGGAEDPRLTQMEGRVYMLFVAMDGMPRLAITSITLEDFLSHNWRWKDVEVISPPGTIDKSGCLLPEKVNGKYVIFHRGLSYGSLHVPDIWIDFVDDLDFKDGKFLQGQYAIRPRKGRWDSMKVGAGAPPIKTKYGWLLIYYAVGEEDSSHYKIGAMILDLKNPAKVLYRSDEPILEPSEWYENQGWKSGVVYPCGAVVKDGELFVYYGGADSVVCVATANLEPFLRELMKGGKPKLKQVKSPGSHARN